MRPLVQSLDATPSGEKVFTPGGVEVRDREGQKWTRVEFHSYNNGKDVARFMDSQRHELYFLLIVSGDFILFYRLFIHFKIAQSEGSFNKSS